METAHLTLVLLALALVLANLLWVWRRRVHRLSRQNPEALCRREIQALRRDSRTRGSAPRSEDVWEAGAAPPDPSHSRSKKAVTWVTIGSLGCGGCGGCGCGG